MSDVEPDLPKTWPLPRACHRCGSNHPGKLEREDREGLRRGLCCADCGLFVKWVPKAELGIATSTKRVGLNLKPSERTALFNTYNNACAVCHRDDLGLEIGHLISVADGKAFGLTQAEIDDPINLAPMCPPCNAGQGDLTFGLAFVIRCLRVHIAKRDARL